MAASSSGGAFDFGAMRRAIESNNFNTLIGFYAPDAELAMVDRNTPPSKPNRITGSQAIGELLKDICGRMLKHRVESEVVGKDRVSFLEHCAYPDGCNVLAAMVLELKNGKIARQTIVQAWDE